MDVFSTALLVAVTAHSDQKSRSGRPYVLHPIRLAEQMDTDQEAAAALLHDVLEDTDITEEYLRGWFPDEVVDAVVALTHQDEPYDEYIEQVSKNKIARKVKMADLRDNMRAERITTLSAKDARRIRRYHQALRRLQEDG